MKTAKIHHPSCLTTILLVFGLIAPSIAQPSNQHVPHPKVPRTPQIIDLLLAGQSDGNQILLTLNNNRPDKMAVAFTAYTTIGANISLKPMMLESGESRLIDLRAILNDMSVHAPLGYIEISYNGALMELGAQLTLYPIWGSPGLDSPRSLSSDFASTNRSAVAWQPAESKAIVAVSNTSDHLILVKLTVNRHEDTLILGSHETAINTHPTNLARPLSVTTDYEGPVDAVRTFGYIKSDTFGNEPIRFYDVSTSTQSVLTAPGISTKARRTVAIVRNVLKSPVTVVPHLVEAGGENPRRRNGRAITVSSDTSVEIDLEDLLKNFQSEGIERATVSLTSNAPKGGLIASMAQELTSKLVQDIPFRSGNPERYMRGAYPLRWEKDYRNLAFIANSSGVDQTVRPYVIAGGINYALPLTLIKADTTSVFDIDALREKQIPDNSGKTIPLWATMGKFHWNPDFVGSKNATVGLMGRMEVVSYQDQRASSFSCGILCDYQYIDGPYLTATPGGQYPGPFYQGSRTIVGTGDYIDAYGNVLETSYPPGSIGLFGYDSSVLSFYGLDSTILNGDSQNAGQTIVSYYEDHYYSYHYDDTMCVYENDPNVVSSGGDVPVAAGGHNAPLVFSSCSPGVGQPLTAGWGQFGVCTLSATVYTMGALDSCTTVGGPPSNPITRNCAVQKYAASQSPTGYLCRTICPAEPRIISNDCTQFLDGKLVLYTSGGTAPCN